MKSHLYFAYGSNLNHADLQAWCRQRGLACPELTFRCTAYLPDCELAFTYRSISRDGGVLDLMPHLGHVVQGVVFEVAAGGWDVLDRKEGAPSYYERIDAVVLDEHGEEMPVRTYRVVPRRREPFVKPHESYVRLVQQGLAAFDLSDDALLAAAQCQPVSPLTDAIFVYGTLLRGQPRFDLLHPYGPQCILLAYTFGRLLDLGHFPGLVELTMTDRIVEGEFIRLAELEPALRELDRIEGFRGYRVTGSLYRRSLIQVDVGDGRIRLAWTYRFAGGTANYPPIDSGDWRVHLGVKQVFLRDLVTAHAGGDESRIASVLAGQIPFSFDPDQHATIRRLLPLEASLARGEISERRIAQITGQWAALVASSGRR